MANYKQTMWYHWTQSWEEMCSQLLQTRTSWLPKQKLLGPFDSITFDNIGESWDQKKKKPWELLLYGNFFTPWVVTHEEQNEI